MNQNISVKVSPVKVRADAEELFLSGYSCSEAVIAALRKNLDPNMPAAFISAATGFSGGVGRSKCMCGTVSGGTLAIGYFLGRVTPTTPTDPLSLRTLAVANELQAEFRKKHKVLCCHVHCKQDSGDNKVRCTGFVGDMAEKAAQLIARELALAVV